MPLNPVSKNTRQFARHLNPNTMARAYRESVPYGVYDLKNNEAGVSIGIGHDTAGFAVTSIRRWWRRMERKTYSSPNRLLIAADNGGSNSPRARLWLCELQEFADQTGMIIEACHYPPGTSKWNKIEHRLFCHITRTGKEFRWRHLRIIGSTETREGLEVHAWMDGKKHEKGRKVTNDEIHEVHIKRSTFHGEWNYEIHPRTN
jgi:hypothetical protein